ncbi:MAG: tetratricopeptide repeat protein [Burkholderiaceae bacterium]|nr:tetratricopeptide repeat protein [Burkholderiaceae bacterium]
MTAFVLIALAMALATVLLLTRPLWWSRKQPVGEGEDAAVETTRSPLPMLAGLSSFVIALLGAGYVLVGAPLALDPQVRTAASNGQGEITFEQIEAMTQRLADRLKQQPDDPTGWAMLGRSYAVLGRHADALPAFKQALTLKPDDANLLTDYADALAVVNGRNLEGEPSQLIARALEMDPNNLKALSLAGTAAYLRKDFAGALRHWDKLAQLAPDSDFVRQIQRGIDEARRQAGTPAPAAQAQAPGAAASAGATASVSGTVTLAKALAGKAAPDDTVFVFARAAAGSRVPLAILRRQVKDLPLKFTLDDSMAMSPAAKLSGSPQVIVGARISKSGGALAQPGDLQGLSAPVSLGTGGLIIEISQVVGP